MRLERGNKSIKYSAKQNKFKNTICEAAVAHSQRRRKCVIFLSFIHSFAIYLYSSQFTSHLLLSV